jgi:CBS domain-containing protein
MAATTRPLLALTASDLMNRDVVTISQDAPLRVVAELFFQRHIGEAAVVDAAGRWVGLLSATDLLCWALGEARGAPEGVSPPACPYLVKGRLLTSADAAICTRTEVSCPLQELRPMTGGRHTAVCLLRDGLVSDWEQVSGGVPANAVRRFLTADVPTVGAEAPLSVLARTVIEAHVHWLIVVDQEHRPMVEASGVWRRHAPTEDVRTRHAGVWSAEAARGPLNGQGLAVFWPTTAAVSRGLGRFCAGTGIAHGRATC